MPLPNDLLNPISPEKPAGENLRYDPIYDKIKLARTEEVPGSQGDWQTERKVADWQVAVKLITETLQKRTKDLQLAVWLAEAMLKREGIPGLRESVDLMRGLIEQFWDGLYPELDEGDSEFRAAPVRWLNHERMVLAVKEAPLTLGKKSWNQFRESRTVGSEAAADSYEKQQLRAELIAEGKITEEEFDKDFDATPKSYYVELEATFDATLDSLSKLTALCDEKFADLGDASPSFGNLRKVLEEVRQTVHILLVKKRETDPDPVSETAPHAEEGEAEEAAGPARAGKTPGKRSGPLTPMPQSMEDAVERVVVSAQYMRQRDPSNPAPYLMLRGLRWGELRAAGKAVDPTMLAAPPLETRSELKRAALAGNWTQVLETAETAMGMECGRGWLDLQRYVLTACGKLGGYYERVGHAVMSELTALLAEYPQLPQMTMMDDMPTANAETVVWLKKNVAVDGNPCEEMPEVAPRALDMALKAAADNRPEAALELLNREIARERSGRGRFQRRLQIARLAMGAGNDAVAILILQQAMAEIEERKLEEWEAGEMLAIPLALYHRCLVTTDGDSGERERLYAWICKLDPLEAMKLDR